MRRTTPAVRACALLATAVAVLGAWASPACASDGVELRVERGASPETSIALAWSAAAGPYQVYRSETASTVTDLPNRIAETVATSYEDTPPAATILFYVVTAGCPVGTAACGSSCVDLATDPANCGGCGISCGDGSCVSGSCQNHEPLGSPCASSTECASGSCVDGFCCEAPCWGVCETCSAAGREGFCDPVPAGQDPDGECAADPASTCDQTGACSGSRSCQLYASGTVCAPATCSNSTTSQRADTCDGGGACVDGGTQGCSPYACNSGTGACRTTCTSDANCATGYACKTATGQCLLADGGSCSLSSECLNNACCTGRCRNLFTDTNNCGQCGRVCQSRNASSNVCSAGACIPTCLSGYSNCDGNGANGCEQCP